MTLRMTWPTTLWVCIALLGAACGVSREAAAQRALDRKDLTELFDRAMQEGDAASALDLARRLNERFAADPVMFYNQACLENRMGDPDGAAATLRNALAAGFEEMGFALSDPDLEGVAGRPELFELEVAERSRLFLLSREKALTLAHEAWSDPMPLDPTRPGPGATSDPRPEFRLNWSDAGLQIEITAPDPWNDFATETAPPWAGGAGVVVIVSVPEGDRKIDSANSFVFALGGEKGGPTAAMFLGEQSRWQRIAEMNPKIGKGPHGAAVLSALIPWPSLMPYHPVVDPALGLNVMIRQGSGRGYPKAALLPDPWAWAPAAARHRLAPLEFRLDSVDRELFAGKVSDSIAGAEPLDLDLTAVSTAEGTGLLGLDFLDPAGRSVLPSGPQTQVVPLRPGANLLQRQADFSRLADGAYLMKANLAFPSGPEAVWSTSVLHLGPGWQDSLRVRIDALPPSERATGDLLLGAVEDAVAAHRTRRNPGPASSTFQDLQAMLRQAQVTGSILPGQGPATFVYPGPGGKDRLSSLYLAPADGKARTPVLVLQDAPGQEGRLIERIARNHEFGDLPAGPGSFRPVYVLLHLDPGANTPDGQVAEAVACLDWALEYFGAPAAAVAGVDALGAAALELARSRAAQVSRVLVFAGTRLEPWPQADAAFIAGKLTPAPPTPVTWVGFPQEAELGGQGPLILGQLEATGWTIADNQEVRGGLSLSQAADRLVLWAVSGP
ncbi:MAG: hypothetical protein AB7V45_06245 [Candidatus Krumholzibacteriia bacterium]